MKKRLSAFFPLTVLTLSAGAQIRENTFPDSVNITIHKSYDQVNGIHRWLFGENYRKEWATEVRLPLISISKIEGGLKAERAGGGMETKSVRMIDPTGKNG